jgi:acetylornithine deacetylase
MKAGVVAAIVATAALHRAGVRTGGAVIAHSIVGEESNEHELGVDALLDRGHRAAAAVIGEPTSGAAPLVPGIATVGWLFCDLRLVGRSTHVALRGEIERSGRSVDAIGVNSVEKAVELVAHLRELEVRWRETKAHPLWEPGDFCIHPGHLHAGPTGTDNPAIYGDQATLRCSVLYPPHERSADVRAEVEAHVAALADRDPWFRAHPVEVTWSLDWPPAEQSPDSPLVVACRDAAVDLRTLTGRRITDQPAAMLGVCDASWFARAGVAAIACGPGSIHHAHAADESVDVAEFVDSIGLYAAQAIRFCGLR